MLFTRKRRRSGISLTSLLVMGGALYFTPAGPWLVQQSQHIPVACTTHIAVHAPTLGQPLCNGLANIATQLGEWSGQTGNSALTSQISQLGLNTETLHQFVQQSMASFRQVAEGHNMQLANRLVQGGGSEVLQGSMQNPLSNSTGLLAKAQRYLQPTSPSYEPARAVPMLQQAANQGNYGFLAQLSLGNMYAEGPSGVPQNSDAARHYFQQAKASLDGLMRSPDGMAKDTLSALPITPEALKMEIDKALAKLP